MNKIRHGQFFTQRNPFNHKEFYAWATRANILHSTILEPFAGANNIINMLKELDLHGDSVSYDLFPSSEGVLYNDSLKNFPQGFKICISNPPYLYKSSAKRRAIEYPDTKFDDIYKYSLALALKNSAYVAMIIPASFLQTALFRDRLSCYISLPYKDMFSDTDCPVCLALFEPQSDKILIYDKDRYIGLFSDLEKKLPKASSNVAIEFNNPHGELGLIRYLTVLNLLVAMIFLVI